MPFVWKQIGLQPQIIVNLYSVPRIIVLKIQKNLQLKHVITQKQFWQWY